jgi:tetraacyldisaccharide 4'-kinase
MSGLGQSLEALVRGEPSPAGVRALARVLSWFYGAGATLNQMAWDRGWRKSVRLPVKVIGVGNLVAGGAGKTPLVMAIVRELKDMGLSPVVISRGYGGTRREAALWVNPPEGPMVPAARAGDEPVLMARRLNVPVWVGADRAAVGRAATERLGRVVLVGDDLFQHRRLHRDLNILVMDTARPLGNGLMLPRGPLREPVSAMRRADSVVLTRADDPGKTATMRRLLAGWLPGVPVLACRHDLTGLRDREGAEVPREEYSGAPVLAFCGLAQPEQFLDGLDGLGLQVAAKRVFPDHHAFSAGDLAELWQEAARVGAAALVCSEKDAARLPEALPQGTPLWVTRLDLDFGPEREALRQMLAQAVSGEKA